jgi:hypothetical protein
MIAEVPCDCPCDLSFDGYAKDIYDSATGPDRIHDEGSASDLSY